MTSYLFSLLAASLAAALIGILSPGGEGSGIGRHLKLLTALFLVAVLISPLQTAVEQIIAFANGDLTLPGLEQTDTPDYREEMDQALTGASKTYITQMLTQTLEQEFSILPGEVRCHILWNDGGQDTLTPNRVTVLLSGKAIWKDPAPIRQFVSDLLGCECRVAIE